LCEPLKAAGKAFWVSVSGSLSLSDIGSRKPIAIPDTDTDPDTDPEFDAAVSMQCV
jgi:hypothetical protein